MGVYSTTVLHFQLSCIIFYFLVSEPFEMNFVWYQKVDFFSLCMQMYSCQLCLLGRYLSTVLCFAPFPKIILLDDSYVFLFLAPLFSAVSFCCSQCSIAAKRHKDHGNSYKKKAFIQDSVTVSEVQFIFHGGEYGSIQEMWLRVVYLNSKATGRERE